MSVAYVIIVSGEKIEDTNQKDSFSPWFILSRGTKSFLRYIFGIVFLLIQLKNTLKPFLVDFLHQSALVVKDYCI